MDARCQCGAVQFQIPTPKPLALYICHCAECRRQTSSAFGTSAIFPRFALPESDALACYIRPVQSGVNLYCYFCRHCGTRLLHSTPNKKVVSVKGGCIDGLDWTRAIHIWTKSAMVPIPEGVESYPQEEEDRRSSVSSSGESYASSQEFLDQPSSGPYLGHTVPGPGPRGAAVGANASAAAAAAGGGARTSAMDEDGVKKDPSVKGLCELSSV